MSRYRRRRKHSPWKTIPLWAISLSLVAWGLYQAADFRQKLIADFQKNRELAAIDEQIVRPSVAVDGVSIARRVPLPARRGYSTDPRLDRPMDTQLPENGATLEILDPQKESTDDAPRRAPRTFPPIDPLPAYDPALAPDALVALGHAALGAGRIPEGRAALNAALARTQDPALAQSLRDLLASLNAPIFLGTDILPDDPLACYIDIEPGDSFLRLGRDFAVTPAYLEALNPALNSRHLKPLSGVKVVQGPFRGRILKAAARFDLYLLDLYIRSYQISLPEGNFLPSGHYRLTPGNKIQVGPRLWIGFEGLDDATRAVDVGWIYGSWGPRGNTPKNRASGLCLADDDLQQLYNVLVESRSHLLVEP
jgi:hypothetical protein